MVGSHHASGHDGVGVAFTLSSILRSIVGIWNNVHIVWRPLSVLVVNLLVWRAFARIVVGSILGRSNAFGSPGEGSAFALVIFVSGCIWHLI